MNNNEKGHIAFKSDAALMPCNRPPPDNGDVGMLVNPPPSLSILTVEKVDERNFYQQFQSADVMLTRLSRISIASFVQAAPHTLEDTIAGGTFEAPAQGRAGCESRGLLSACSTSHKRLNP